MPLFENNQDYFNKFWTGFCDNEKILNEIQDVSLENQRSLNQIYNLEDFYENNLLPKMLAFPHQYVTRVTNNHAMQTKNSGQKENILVGSPLITNKENTTSAATGHK